MKLPRLFSSLAVVAIVAACGGTATQKADASESVPSDANATTAVKDGPVIKWAGGRISPDKDLPTVIDFNAVWCGPCRKFEPVFEEVAEEFSGRYKFVSVDVDLCPEAAQQFQVSSIPQITILRPDGSQNSAVGYMTADEFRTFISM